MSNKKQSNNYATVFDNNKKIPRDWKLVKIEKCCEILDSKRIPLNSQERKQKQGNIPYCGANGIHDYIDDYIFDENLVLLVEDGGNFLEFQTKLIAYMIRGKSWVNNHAHVLKNKPNYDLDFIFYSLVHKNIIPWINGTRSKLNQSELREIKILIPPLLEQQKISVILSNMDNTISEMQKELKQTQNQKEGLAEKLLTKGIEHTQFKNMSLDGSLHEIEIPKDWEIITLQSISEHITKGSTPTTYGYAWSKKSDDILFIRNECIKSNDFQLNGSARITKRHMNL